MYVRRSKLRLVYRIGFVLLALIVFAPKFELPVMNQVTAILNPVVSGQPTAGQASPSV